MSFVHSEAALMLTGMLVNFCSSVNYSFMTPFFPPYAQQRGIEPLWYSLVGGLGDGLYILTLFCNRIYRKVNTKKMVWISLVVQSISMGLFGFTNRIENNGWFIFVCIILRTITGLSITNLTLSSFAMIILELKHKKALAMSNFEIAFGFGLICGPALGGFFYRYVNYTMAFLVLASLNFFVFLWCKINFKHLKPQLKPEDAIDVTTLLVQPLILINMLEIIFISFVFSFMNSLFSPFLHSSFPLNSFQIGLIFGLGGIFQAISEAGTGRLLHRGTKIYKLNFVGMVFLLIGLWFISPDQIFYDTPTLWLTAASSFVLMFGVGMKFLANTYELVPIICELGYCEDNIFVYISVYMLIYTSTSIGILTGSISNGKLVESIGFHGACLSLFTLLFIMFIITRTIYAITNYRKRKIYHSTLHESVITEQTPLVSSNNDIHIA